MSYPTGNIFMGLTLVPKHTRISFLKNGAEKPGQVKLVG